jgi:hypothetical protein
MLLDVARVPGASEVTSGRPEAFLRGSSGQIVVRIPDEDRKNPIYAIVNQSAKDGEDQGQPAAPEAEKPKERPDQLPRPGHTRPPPPPPPGGGGGAGGG